MRCPRCVTGLLIPIASLVDESNADYLPEFVDYAQGSHKCLNCGEVRDAVILANRGLRVDGGARVRDIVMRPMVAAGGRP